MPRIELYLAQCIEYRIKIDQNLASGDFSNVVHALGGKVAYPTLRIREAYKQGVDKLLHIWRNVCTQRNTAGGKRYEAPITHVQRMRGIGEELNHLIQDSFDPRLLMVGVAIANLPAKPLWSVLQSGA